MKEDYCGYIRVRTDYYKIVERPRIDGTCSQELIPWNLAMIIKDNGKEFVGHIPCYDDFIVKPEHVNYERVVTYKDWKYWNQYQPLEMKPSAGDFPHIDRLMQHIFDEQKELGYDYLQLLYLNPAQKLPVLVLVSRERNTGKSTFLNFLSMFFGNNVTFNTSNDFESQFNSDWSGKLLICVDEAMLNQKELSEKIKNLSTAMVAKMEAKGKDRKQQEFFAKFVFVSNNIDDPIHIEPGETRYWVREVMPLAYDDVNFLKELRAEIPHLMYFLLHRKMSVQKASRMYFLPEDLFTPALQRIMLNSRSEVESAMCDLCDEIFKETGAEEFTFVVGEILTMLQANNYHFKARDIRSFLKGVWHLSPRPKPSTYTCYSINVNSNKGIDTCRKSGRFYTVSREFIDQLLEKCRFCR